MLLAAVAVIAIATTTASAKQSRSHADIKVGLVTDVAGLGDKSFNFLANKGLQQAKSKLGVTVTVKESKSDSDYVPNRQFFAAKKYDLVIAVGFLMAKSVGQVAKQFPSTKFAIIDQTVTDKTIGKAKNVQGLLFREQDAGYLVGYMAGLLQKQGGFTRMNTKNVMSTVGGLKIPPVDHYIAGFQAGAKKADPSIKTLNAYSQDFVDQAKCKELALNQIAKGSKVEFQVAGQCGLGVLDAAKAKSIQGIGVDADQAYLGPQVFTSALKKVDVAVLNAIKGAQEDKFTGGQDVINSVKSGGIGYGKLNTAATKYDDQVKKVQDDIASGAIANIPDTVK
jgi:basic membrane protein A